MNPQIRNVICSRFKWRQATWAIPVGNDEDLVRDKLNTLMQPLVKGAGYLNSPSIHKPGVYDQIVWRLVGVHIKSTLESKEWPAVYAVVKNCFENSSSQSTRYWENGTEVSFILGQRDPVPILGVALRIHARHAFNSLNSQPFIVPISAIETLLKRVRTATWKKVDIDGSTGRDERYGDHKGIKPAISFFFPMLCWLMPLCFFGLSELSEIFEFISEGFIGTFISLGLIASIITGSIFTIK